MMYLLKVLIPISLLAVAISLMLFIYISSTEDPCADSETYGEYQACQFLERAEERCESLKGTDIYTKCIVGGN